MALYLAYKLSAFVMCFRRAQKKRGKGKKPFCSLLIFCVIKTHIMIIVEALISQANHVSLRFYIFQMSPER